MASTVLAQNGRQTMKTAQQTAAYKALVEAEAALRLLLDEVSAQQQAARDQRVTWTEVEGARELRAQAMALLCAQRFSANCSESEVEAAVYVDVKNRAVRCGLAG